MDIIHSGESIAKCVKESVKERMPQQVRGSFMYHGSK